MKRNDSMSVVVHDQIVSGPVPALNLAYAKGGAASIALSLLKNPSSGSSLATLCNCKKAKEQDDAPKEVREKDLNDETEEGFTTISLIRLKEFSPDTVAQKDDQMVEENEAEELERQEVEYMLRENASRLIGTAGQSFLLLKIFDVLISNTEDVAMHLT